MDLEKLDKIIDKYQNQKNALVGLLQDISSEFGYLPEDGLRHVSKQMDVPLSKLYGLATFYKAFRLEPRGKHEIYVCMGTACHVRNAPKIVEKLQFELGIKPGQTTKDLQFTLETVNCLGACALGPLMVIDGKYYGKMTVSKVEKILKDYKK